MGARCLCRYFQGNISSAIIISIPIIQSVLTQPQRSSQLETDTSILLRKATSALEKNDVHAVVANELSTRKRRVSVVSREGVELIEVKEPEEIEKPIVDFLLELHKKYIKNQWP